MTEEEKEELNNLVCLLERHHIGSNILFKMENKIQKQQEEIDKLQWLYERAISDVEEADKELKKQQDIIKRKECVIETQLHNEEVLTNQLKKKDKIINEMVGYITTRVWATCPNEDCGANLNCKNKCDIGIEEDCWKQYFERKVENED